MTEELFNKFFIVGEIKQMDHTVSYSIGNMYGKVQLYPTKNNIFFDWDHQYIGIYDHSHQGLVDVFGKFPDFFKFIPIKPMELYEYIELIYKKKHPNSYVWAKPTEY
jgi:hypothetical protein